MCNNKSICSPAKAESPRPVSRRKNKPAPEPPGQSHSSSSPSVKTSPHVRTPDKEEKKSISETTGSVLPERFVVSDNKPVLPPTGPDSKRLSTFAHPEKKPTLAPRPSLNPLIERAALSSQSQSSAPAPIGFEAIEGELKRHGSVRQVANAYATPPKSNDEDVIEIRKPSTKRQSTFEGNPTPHPNAVSMFGGFQPPTPVDRTKFDTEKSRPSVPERPAIIKLHGSNSVTNFNPN